MKDGRHQHLVQVAIGQKSKHWQTLLHLIFDAVAYIDDFVKRNKEAEDFGWVAIGLSSVNTCNTFKQMKTHKLLHPLVHADSTMKPGGLKVWSSSSFVMFQMLLLVPQSSSAIWRWCKPIPWWHLEPPTTDYKQIFNPQSLTHSFPKWSHRRGLHKVFGTQPETHFGREHTGAVFHTDTQGQAMYFILFWKGCRVELKESIPLIP